MNKIIVAGSRSINDYSILEEAIANSNFRIDEVVCGCARGVDEMGKIWAEKHEVPITYFPAKWDDLTELPQKIKYNKYGREYNSLSGFNRNKRMSEFATHLICKRKAPGKYECLIDDFLRLRSEGYSYREIGKKYNISHGQIIKVVNKLKV